jgi:hypothetical protein
LEGKKTEPNRTEINRFEPVFGSVRFKKLKKNQFGYLFWFKTGPNRKCSALRLTYKGKGKDLLLPSLQEA